MHTKYSKLLSKGEPLKRVPNPFYPSIEPKQFFNQERLVTAQDLLLRKKERTNSVQTTPVDSIIVECFP